jgi:hypothetical protein
MRSQTKITAGGMLFPKPASGKTARNHRDRSPLSYSALPDPVTTVTLRHRIRVRSDVRGCSECVGCGVRLQLNHTNSVYWLSVRCATAISPQIASDRPASGRESGARGRPIAHRGDRQAPGGRPRRTPGSSSPAATPARPVWQPCRCRSLCGFLAHHRHAGHSPFGDKGVPCGFIPTFRYSPVI